MGLRSDSTVPVTMTTYQLSTSGSSTTVPEYSEHLYLGLLYRFRINSALAQCDRHQTMRRLNRNIKFNLTVFKLDRVSHCYCRFTTLVKRDKWTIRGKRPFLTAFEITSESALIGASSPTMT